MDVTKQQVDALNAVVTVKLGNEDYEPKVKEVLKSYRRNAKIDGFRPGKAPEGMIRKMYGRYVMVEEINKLIMDGLNQLVEKENLNLLGEPLPSEKQKEVDFDKGGDFEFVFDIALAPEMQIELNKDIKLNYYNVSPDEKMISDYVEHYTRRYGSFVSQDSVVESGKEMVRGNFTQLDAKGKNELENGIKAEDTAIYLEFLKDEKINKKFIGLKTGDTVSFDILKAFPNETEVTSILRIKKEDIEAEILKSPFFKFEITSMSYFQNSEVNQELFDKIYGEGSIKSREEFDARVNEELESNLKLDSDTKFRMETRRTLTDKFVGELPQEFLKRWLMHINTEKFSAEEIEKDFPVFEKDLKWQLVRNRIIKDNKIELQDDEIMEFAKQDVKFQFTQYGMYNLAEEQITSYAEGMMQHEENSKRIINRIFDNKVFDIIRNNVSLKEKTVKADAFDKLMEEERQA